MEKIVDYENLGVCGLPFTDGKRETILLQIVSSGHKLIPFEHREFLVSLKKSPGVKHIHSKHMNADVYLVN